MQCAVPALTLRLLLMQTLRDDPSLLSRCVAAVGSDDCDARPTSADIVTARARIATGLGIETYSPTP
eukprot:986295-Amphidinium_carterae.1